MRFFIAFNFKVNAFKVEFLNFIEYLNLNDHFITY